MFVNVHWHNKTHLNIIYFVYLCFHCFFVFHIWISDVGLERQILLKLLSEKYVKNVMEQENWRGAMNCFCWDIVDQLIGQNLAVAVAWSNHSSCFSLCIYVLATKWNRSCDWSMALLAVYSISIIQTTTMKKKIICNSIVRLHSKLMF